jgi:hypothetical protein
MVRKIYVYDILCRYFGRIMQATNLGVICSRVWNATKFFVNKEIHSFSCKAFGVLLCPSFLNLVSMCCTHTHTYKHKHTDSCYYNI